MSARHDATPQRSLHVNCPTCKTPCGYGPANPWRPFCSERCKRVDLGAWASERFRVDAVSPDDEGTADGAAPPDPPLG